MKTKINFIYYGLLSGLIIIVGWIIWHLIYVKDSQINFNRGEFLGYTFMIIALSMVFFGVKTYRDKSLNGIISFRDAFLNGLIIVLVASVVYVVGWEVYYPNFLSDFGNQYQEFTIAQYENEGRSAQEIDQKKAEMAEWLERYQNPLVRMPLTFMEIFPVGLIIAVFSALILKKKPGNRETA